MGIINVTPDSFSDGGREHPIARAEAMIADGASIIDVGGESTRPGARAVPPDEEQRRILPVIGALARQGALVSVDTRNASTMARALDAGAAIVNDVSGLQFDPAAAGLIASRNCPVILMHMRGTPQTMNAHAEYQDVAAEVLAELAETLSRAEAAGIAREHIAIDPGFGFAKIGDQNIDLLRRLSHFLNLSCPIIAGLSRKRFLGGIAGEPLPEGRDAASVAAALFAVGQGASVLRVHDVRSTVQALRVWTALTGLPRRDEERSR